MKDPTTTSSILDVLRDEDVYKALEGKTACACGCGTVYRYVTGRASQSFTFTGTLVATSYDFQPDSTLRCTDCGTVIENVQKSALTADAEALPPLLQAPDAAR